MKVYRTDEIRNVVLLGHGGSGKTSLAEAMLYVSGATNRMGKISESNTVSDFDKEEQKRGFSISTSLIPIEWEKAKINILDTPGYFDFVGATSRVVSNLRPRQEILGVTPNERTLRRMSIYWGVRPLKSLEVDTTEDICENAIELAQVKQYVEPGDVVVITAGIPSTNVSKERSFTSNMMRIATVD